MRKITVTQQSFESMELKNNKIYRFYRGKPGKIPRAIGKRFKGKDLLTNIPKFKDGYFYNIRKLKCIPGSNVIPDRKVKFNPFRLFSRNFMCYTFQILIIVTIIAGLIFILTNLNKTEDFHSLLVFWVLLIYYVFSKNYTLPGTSEKIVDTLYNIPNKIRKNN